jgi:hypothetical protein
MIRYTFVVHVHPGGISTLENLRTREVVQVEDVVSVGPQISRWLRDLSPVDGGAAPTAVASPDRDDAP